MLNKMNFAEYYDDSDVVMGQDKEKYKEDVSKCYWALGVQLIGTLGDCLNSMGALVKEEN